MKQTHVEIPKDFSQPTHRVDLFGDGIGYVESYDFSRANLSNDHRIGAISTVASVCYQSPKAAGSISLYNRLANESMGLPSSSFEFVPVLIDLNNKAAEYNVYKNDLHADYLTYIPHCLKFGERVEGERYLLTNLRALMADVGDRADEFFNTEEECAIIAKHHKVFQSKMPIWLSKQFNRHRVSLQELSRRYVSGKKSELEFYVSPKMKSVVNPNYVDNIGGCPNTDDLQEICVEHYFKAISEGIKPEEARGILPQSLYTTIWSAWQPSQLKSYLALRMDKHTQKEHRELAEGMQTTIKAEIAV